MSKWTGLRRLSYNSRGRGAGASFTPESLFAASEAGAWYDPSDLSTLWQDTGGTVAVTADGQSVARIDDKSGNGNHATQATSSKRPVYKTSGGLHWLLGDGVDDGLLTASFVLNQPATRVSSLRQVSYEVFDRFCGDRTAGGMSLLQSGTSPEIGIRAGATLSLGGAASIGSNVVVTEIYNGTSSKGAINNNAYTTGDAGTNNNDGMVLLAYQTGPNRPANMHMYGYTMLDRVLTDDEITDTRNYMAEKAGVTL